MYVDSHCHLSFPELSARLPEIRAEMQAAGVDRALCICTTLEEFDRVHRLALDHDNFWASAGVHPDEEQASEPTVEGLAALAARPKVVAIGETGLDYYRLHRRSIADMERQRARVSVHLRASPATGQQPGVRAVCRAAGRRAEGRDGRGGRARHVAEFRAAVRRAAGLKEHRCVTSDWRSVSWQPRASASRTPARTRTSSRPCRATTAT